MTPDRNALIDGFLTKAGWDKTTRLDLAGDASMRSYQRLHDPSGKTAILMDAAPETNGDIRTFVAIARHLTGIGLSAPRIYDEDNANGFLLLEDLGDDLFARVIPKDPQTERPLYQAATDVLAALHRETAPTLTVFGSGLMAEQANLVFETWVKIAAGPSDPGLSDAFRVRFRALLEQTTYGKRVMILRDYHAENLLWLPDRSGAARVGLLDFQDAMLAHPAYDLVSLLQDVRRDVPVTIEEEMIARYIQQTGQDDHRFRVAYAVLGTQRALRILAVFARLAHTLHKPFYATLIPRTWANLTRGLNHPALASIAPMLMETLPPPTTANLQTLTRHER